MQRNPLPSKQTLIWCDTYVNSPENQKYYKQFDKDDIHILLKLSIDETVKYLEQTSENIIVITSGSLGESLAKAAKELSSCIGIIIFCGSVVRHKDWIKNFPMIIGLYDGDFGDVIKKSRNYFSEFVENSKSKQWVNEKISKLEKFFEAIYLNFIKSNVITPNEILKQLQILNKVINFNSPPTETSNAQLAKIFLDKYDEKDENFLEAIIYNLVNIIMKSMEKPFIIDFESTMIIAAACYQQLKIKRKSDKNLNLILPTKTKIYFRVSDAKTSIFISQDQGFITEFIVTFTSLQIAERFSTKNGNIVEIELLEDDPYPNICIPKSYSAMTELKNKVLLFPYFPYEVKAKETKNDYTLIKIKQSDARPTLSFDIERIKLNIQELIYIN